MLAILNCHKDLQTVTVLVKCGADLNVQNKVQECMLMFATTFHVLVLVICVTPQEGLTALMMAVKGGQTATVNTLVESHADVNVRENVSSACESCGLYVLQLCGGFGYEHTCCYIMCIYTCCYIMCI